MSYQLCRWYDPYPRLAFALKLLYLAPGPMQNKASRALLSFLDEQWEAPQARRAFQEMRSKPTGKRWYDEDYDIYQTVELLKNSPEPLKSRLAEKLLEILMAQSA